MTVVIVTKTVIKNNPPVRPITCLVSVPFKSWKIARTRRDRKIV